MSGRASWKPSMAVLAIAAMWLVGFEGDHRIPVLTYVNLGIHELGHLLTYALSDLATALAGSLAQMIAPLAIGVYFFVRGDWVAAGLCLAWAATSALEVAIYVADAPTEDLELIGGSHDWAYILGPEGYDDLERAGPLAETIRSGAWFALVTGAALCAASAFRMRPQAEAPAAAASVATPASSPWAATATSGSAPRSASSPK